MLVDVSEQKPTTKQAKGRTTSIKAEVKTEPEPEAVASENIRVKLKKGKARNVHLPSGLLENGIWHLKFLPCVMYWVGKSDYRWTVPEVMFVAIVYNVTKVGE